jgi:hypothetical protein
VGLFGLARSRDTREKRRANYGPWIWIAAAGIEHGPAVYGPSTVKNSSLWLLKKEY